LNSDLLSKNKIGETLATFSVAPKIVFEGCHFNSLDEIVITSLTCSYSFLTAWMDDLTHESLFKNQVGPFQDFDSRLYKRVTVEIEDGFSIHIEQFLRKHERERSLLSFKIHHSVVFTAKNERGFIEFEQKAIEFQKLMELGLDCPINSHLTMMGKEEGERPMFIYRGGNGNARPDESDSYRNHGSMLFSYYKLGENDFKKVIKNWFTSYKTYSVVCNVYLDTHQWFKGTGVFLTSVMFNNRVLNIIQGLEHYHRLTTLQLKKQLDQRLPELLEKCGHVLDQILSSPEKKKAFINELDEIRNSLSHGRNINLNIGAQSYEIYEQARILLLACILDALGMTKEKTQELIVQSHEYGPLLRFMASKA
jgi:hypothetical protein